MFSRKNVKKAVEKGGEIMKTRFSEILPKLKSTKNLGVNVNDLCVNVEFNSGYFTVENGRFYTTKRYGKNGVKKVLEFCDCIAYISCPIGKIAVHFEPVVDAKTFVCYGIGDIDYSNNSIKMIEVERSPHNNVIRCRNNYDCFYNFPLDMVEYLYNESIEEDEEGVPRKFLTIKKEVVGKIREKMMEKDIKSYLKSMGYKELCDVEEWMETMSNNGNVFPMDESFKK